jgi:predicted small integral membrane protein
MEWMHWTLPTAAFFASIALMFVVMTVWQFVQPSVPRRGFLPITTTRGDRLFIGLLGTAYIVLAWLGAIDASLWWALGVALVWMIVVMRWG